MAEGQSPENSPPSSTPPSPPSSDTTQQQSPPTPDSSSSSPPSSSPPATTPPPDNASSPPPPDNASSPPPPSSDSQSPPQGNNNNNNNNGGNNDNNNNNNNNGGGSNNGNNNNNGNSNNGNNNNNNGNSGGGSNNNSPSPPSRNNNGGGSNNNSPSPPRSLAPPRSSGGGSNSSRNDVNTGAIIGIVAGAGLLLLVMILFCVCCCRKKKKKHQMPYYASNGYATGKGGGDQYQQQYNQSGHVMNMSGQYSGSNHGNNNWMNSPPPPPPGSWQPSQPPVSGGLNSSEIYSGPHGPALPPPHPSVALGFNQSTFTYDELAAATQGFSKDRLLGQGGFGYVFKGILPNGKEIAVKSLKAGSGQGEREFQAEVEIISRVHHRFLVSLVGYCIAGEQRMLVYEFLPNDTLEFHLHGKNGTMLDWPTRLQIALGSAKGLAYLHEDCHPRIIHRDIKASNILLDETFEAKVADFGLAKLSQDNVTHVSTRIMGTFGYLAPEYASSGKLTDRSDVFSFGVMLLELITGRRPVDLTGEMEDSLADWARPLCLNAAQDGDYSELVDPRLENQYEPYEMARMVACAVAAIRHSARRRPKMSQIVRALEGDASLDDLNEGAKPGQSALFGRGSSSDYDSGSYTADMKKFRKVALDSQEYGASSEYGNTSEYGLDPSSSSSEEARRGGANNNKTTPNREF
ncbi:hypothetical protein BRARA_A02907 [Brassica rapa]|uniref:non-specific serine/threonine protein kinase n=1 Tax=Brassica campestris TaxID=3711 RepID=A0A398AR73_BRACM|nr:hypothetical protein BRARA_A02907 [Brassica rapa]